MTAWGILAAAGAGERLGLDDGVPKAMRRVGARPMFWYGLRALDAVEAVEGVALVVDPLWMEHALSELVDETLRVKVAMVAGGETRQASVAEGLKAVPETADAVVVHDAARPLVQPVLFERALAALADADAAVCAVPVADTLKRVTDGTVLETVSREGLWQAQTPQAFGVNALREAHERAAREGLTATDDAMLVERTGGRVVIVDGDARNLKITTRDDLVVASVLLGGEEV